MNGHSHSHHGKEELIELVVDKELQMFLSVPADKPYSCQEDDENFRRHRKSQFISWPEDALLSYLDDLISAEVTETNLMTLKYARMDNLIPPLNSSPLIHKITAVRKQWQEELFALYPKFMAGARPVSMSEDTADSTSFETYLRCELETYSNKTLACLFDDIQRKAAAGRNGTLESYEYLVRSFGYGSIEEIERGI